MDGEMLPEPRPAAKGERKRNGGRREEREAGEAGKREGVVAGKRQFDRDNGRTNRESSGGMKGLNFF
jgi:hypothetical protein